MIERKVPKVFNYKNEKQATLDFAYNINESRKFGDIFTLDMKIPYYQQRKHGGLVLDDNGEPVYNYNIQKIKNEYLIKFNDYTYIVKRISPIRERNNKKYITIYCEGKSKELTYKNIAYLDMSPPIFNPVLGSTAIINVLSAKFSKSEGNPQASTSNTITLSSTASSVNDYYNGNRVAIIDGTGQGQDIRITDYDGTTKVATLESSFTTQPNTNSVYRVHYSKWTLGNIESSFLNDGTNDIFRSYKFEDKTITECLHDISDKLDGYLTYDFVWDSTYDEFVNKVNLVNPRVYDNVEIRYKKNLLSLTREIDSTQNIYTRVFPYGSDNLTINDIATTSRTDSGVTYNDHELGQSYIENYQYYLSQGYDIDFCRETFVNDYEINDTTYVDEQDLFEDAKESLERASVPKVTYKVSAIDFSVLSKFDYEKIEQGDTIKVVDKELGVDVFATVIDYNIPHDNPQRATLTLSNYIDNLGDYIYRVIRNSNKYTDLNKVYGKSTTFVLADRETSKNWRYADYFIPEGELSNKYIESLINSLPTRGGKLILLDGIYKTEYGLNIDANNIRIEGQGNSTVLELYEGDNSQDQVPIIKFSSSSGIGLSNIKIDGRASTISETYSKVGVEFDACTDCVVSNISIENVFSKGLKLTGVENFNIDNLSVKNVIGESIGTDDSEDVGLYILFSSSVIVSSFNIENTNLAIFESSNSSNNLFVDGNCFTNRWSALFTNGENSKYDNIIVDSGEEGIFAAGVGVFNSIEVYNCNYGVVFNTEESRLSNSIIHDNNVGVWIYLATYSEVFNNKIYNNNSYGIDAQAFYSIYSGNYIYNNSLTSSVPSVVIRNTGIKFDNNTVKDYNGNSSVALKIESGVENTILIGNDLLNDTIPSLYDNGTNTQTYGNIT